MIISQLIDRLVSMFRQSISQMKKRTLKRYMRSKLAFLVITVTLALFMLSTVLANIVKQNGTVYVQQVLSQLNYSNTTITAARGGIQDRNGITLATSEQVYILILDPKVILSDEENITVPTVTTLVNYFGFDKEELENTLNENKDSSYLRYKGKLVYTYDQIKDFLDLQETNNSDKIKYNDIKGVWFENEYRRIYPYNDLACHVLGFTTSDGSQGLWGIENYYDDQLTGTNGREYGYLDDDYNLERKTINPIAGNTVITTIDYNLQKIVEDNINEFMDNTGAKNVGVVMLQVNTGEILAMSSDVMYDLNNPKDLTKFYSADDIAAMTDEQKNDAWNTIWRNFCISDTYEPGSTAKPMTIAAALEVGAVSESDSFYCDGGEMVAGWRIKCHYTPGHGWLSLSAALQQSCNDSLMQIVFKEGKDVFSKYQTIFGLGKKTGVDLPGEASGLLYLVDQLNDAELATSCFGQSYTVNMLQLSNAIASLVNGGKYYKPHVVKQILSADGDIVETIEPQVVNETVSEETSKFIRSAMYQTVENGTASYAKLEGYQIGAKTGTAEKIPRHTGKYVISLVSFTPVENPEVLLYVIIDEPHIANQDSSEYAQYLSRDIWEDCMPYLGIFPTGDTAEKEKEEKSQEETQDAGAEDSENNVYDNQEAVYDAALDSGGDTAEIEGDYGIPAADENAADDDVE